MSLKFKIEYISKDKNGLEIYIIADNKEQALKLGKLKIKNLFYEHFNYVLKTIEEVKLTS